MPNNLVHVVQIENRLSEYERGTLSLKGLERWLGGEAGALEGPTARRLEALLSNFVNQIDYIQIMFDEKDHRAKVIHEMKDLKAEIENYKLHGDPHPY